MVPAVQPGDISLDPGSGICYNKSYWGDGMRKRISCKVIRSVPLGACDDRQRSTSRPGIDRPGIGNVAGFTRTGRPLMASACVEDGMRSRALDFYV